MQKHFEEQLRKIDSLIPITVESKQSVQLNDGVWNSETMTCTEYVPLNAPDSYKIYARLKASFINRISIFESLHFGAVGISIDVYMRALDDIKKNIRLLEEYYKVESVSLLIVDRTHNPPARIELFEDISLCDFWLQTNYSISAKDIMDGKFPDHLKGSFIQKQTWHTKQGSVFNEFPQVTNLYDKPETEFKL